MSDLDRRLRARREAGEGILVAYVTVGDPDVDTTVAMVDEIVAGGADVVELGVPFSDPVADGPTIQAAAQRALEKGVGLAEVLETARRVRERHAEVGLVLMGYANPFFQYGIEEAAAESATAGVDAWIVPDVPVEESPLFLTPLRAHGLTLVPLLAPTTPTERAKRIVETMRPAFAYYVSVTGVTGARKGFPPGWHEPVDAMRAGGEVPFVVGFGVSSGELAREARAHADGVVVGSALVDRIAAGGEDVAERVRAFVDELREAV